MAAERDHATMRKQALAVLQSNRDEAAGVDLDALDGRVEAELDPERLGGSGQLLREQMAVAGLVVGQAQAAAHALLHARECRLGAREFVAAEQLERNAELLQDGDITRRRIE